MRTQTELAALGGHSAEHQDIVLGAAIAVFIVIVLVLAHVYRKSGEKVEIEEVDAFLREEEIL